MDDVVIRAQALSRFIADVNLVFVRNGVAYEFTAGGQARRLLPQALAEALAWSLFATGDAVTDQLLEAARTRIASPKPTDRQDALEKLWDPFERLKTLEPGPDKKAQADALLNRVALPGSKLREIWVRRRRRLPPSATPSASITPRRPRSC
jgi:hypothetical protein